MPHSTTATVCFSHCQFSGAVYFQCITVYFPAWMICAKINSLRPFLDCRSSINKMPLKCQLELVYVSRNVGSERGNLSARSDTVWFACFCHCKYCFIAALLCPKSQVVSSSDRKQDPSRSYYITLTQQRISSNSATQHPPRFSLGCDIWPPPSSGSMSRVK